MPPPKARATSVVSSGGVEKNPRKTAKSRNGCQTCKVKRLKCDERRPACENCIKRGYDCPGYNKVLKWSTKYEVLQPDESKSKKVFHPSVEYQFSSINASSFGDVGPSSGETTIQSGVVPEGDAGQPDVFEQIIDDTVANNVQPAQFVPGLEAQGPYCAWVNQVSDYPSQSQQSVIPFRESNPFTHQQFGDTEGDDDEIEVLHRQNNKSPQDIAQWKSLLRAYYRINTPPVSKSLRNESTALVEHYFRDVCALYSGYDSKMNPFRTVIAQLWDNSSSIFYAIQSMAAAHLANYIPEMGVTGLQMQHKAYESLQQELQLAHTNQTLDGKLLLTMLLLGLSCSWHDPCDLGMAHLTAARALILPRLVREDDMQAEEIARNDQFFAEALIYWEMCLAFVSPEPLKAGKERPLKNTNIEEKRAIGVRVVPHPWTGIAPRVQMIFAEVGRLVRSHCARKLPLSYGTTSRNSSASEILAAAMDFEEELLSIDLPTVDDMIDVQDEKTGKADFVMVAEASRCAALLEIYRIFPEILSKRLDNMNDESSSSSTSNGSQSSFLSFDQRLNATNYSHTAWLTALARHIILDLLGAVPSSSGTRPLQLIMLVTAASELRMAGPTVSSPGLSITSAYDFEVARARGFAMTRLHEMASRLPSKPIFQSIELVREVWRRYDDGEDVFWLDVMHQNGWQTILG